MNIDKDPVAAIATPLVLAILVEGTSYGYAILRRADQRRQWETADRTLGGLWRLPPSAAGA